MKNFTTAITAFLLLSAPALADTGDAGYGHMHMFGGEGWGYMMMMGPLMMLFFLGVAVLLTLAIVRWLWPGVKGGEDQAVAMLRERFAKGELDKAEFDERLRSLQGR